MKFLNNNNKVYLNMCHFLNNQLIIIDNCIIIENNNICKIYNINFILQNIHNLVIFSNYDIFRYIIENYKNIPIKHFGSKHGDDIIICNLSIGIIKLNDLDNYNKINEIMNK